MKILYWVGRVGDKFGGFERYNSLLAAKCRERGHQIVMMHDTVNTHPEYNERLKRAHSAQVVIGNTYSHAFSSFLRASQFIRSWKPHLAHVHFASPLSWAVLRAQRVPLVYQTWHTAIDHHIGFRT